MACASFSNRDLQKSASFFPYNTDQNLSCLAERVCPALIKIAPNHISLFIYFSAFFLISLLNCVPCVLKACSRPNVLCVLMCLACLGAHVPTCLASLRALVPTCLACLRANMPTCLVRLRAHVPTWFACLRAHVSACLTCLCAHLLTYLKTLCVHVPMFLRA